MRRSIPERLDLVDRHLALWAMVGQLTGHGCSDHSLDAKSLRHEDHRLHILYPPGTSPEIHTEANPQYRMDHVGNAAEKPFLGRALM